MNNYLFSLFCLYLGGIIGTTGGILLYYPTKKCIGWGLIWPVVFYKMYLKKDW